MGRVSFISWKTRKAYEAKNFAKQIIQYLLSWSLLQMRKHYSWERYIINVSEQFQDRVEVETEKGAETRKMGQNIDFWMILKWAELQRSSSWSTWSSRSWGAGTPTLDKPKPEKERDSTKCPQQHFHALLRSARGPPGHPALRSGCVRLSDHREAGEGRQQKNEKRSPGDKAKEKDSV